MRLTLKGVSHYRLNADGKEMRVTCESFEQEFELAPPQEKERKKLTKAQMDMLERKRQASELFDYFNSKGITKHRELGAFNQFLVRKLGKEKPEVLRQMIDNYASIYDPTGQNMWWSSKWSIKKVLTDDRFHPDNFNANDYRVKGKESNREDDVKELYSRSGIDYWKE